MPSNLLIKHTLCELFYTSPNFSQPSSRIALVYQSVCSRTIADRLQYGWMAEKNWSSTSYRLFSLWSCNIPWHVASIAASVLR